MTLVTLAHPGSYSSSLASKSAAESTVPGGGRRRRCDWLFVRPMATACRARSTALTVLEELEGVSVPLEGDLAKSTGALELE